MCRVQRQLTPLLIRYRAKLRVSNLILGCRNIEKGEAAKELILAQPDVSPKSSVEVWNLDLDSFDSVKSFADRVITQLPRLDGLIANAGIALYEFSTSEGFERTLTVNVVSTFLLCLLVLPKIKETAKTHSSTTHLEILGSQIHMFAPHKQLQVSQDMTIFDSLNKKDTADMQSRYFLSKLMVHLCARELAPRVTAESKAGAGHVTVNWVNPGWCKTELFRQQQPHIMEKMLLAIIGRTGEQGSRTLVHAVMAGPATHNRYLSECQVKLESSWVRSAEGKAVQERLWRELCVILEKIRPGVTNVLD